MATQCLFKPPSANLTIYNSKIDAKSNQSSSLYFESSKKSPETLKNPWLGTNSSLSVRSSTTHFQRRRRFFYGVVSSLPNAASEGLASDQKVPKWSWRAIKSFAMGELEARKLKYPTTGTEALLMGILIEGTSFSSKFLWANGITLFKVREETIKLLGKADMYFFSPEHPPLTKDAQKALDWAVDQKLKADDDGEITTIHILLGIWSQAESPGHKILATLGFEDGKAKELESFISKPGFADE